MHRLLKISKKIMPKISETERIALNSGTTSIEGLFFNGKISSDYIKKTFAYPIINKDNKVFKDVDNICNEVNDFEIFQKKEIPQNIMKKLSDAKLYGLIIPKKYGGHELNHHEQSQLVQKLATASSPVGVTVMVPNSLGPAELLMKYGTEQQKNMYLPKLSSGELIPCFGLTGIHSGSDAANMRDTGVIVEKDGKKYIKLNVNKRYITLAPISNLIGIAFILQDPNKLLQKGKEGITLILVNKGEVETGDRHYPMDIPFMNGTIKANDILIPIEKIIGGEENAGNGWKMLMECLAVGRAISLPACAVGSAKFAVNYVGCYSVYRKQFKTMLCDMEGVQDKLYRMATETTKLTSMQYLTNSVLDTGAKPSVLSAIMKYETTERSREIINHGMDIVGGAGICKGPRNYLANMYQTIPIGITVEGSNTLTKNLIIFGQGLMKSHPHLYSIVEAIETDNYKLFKKHLFGIISHTFKNIGRSYYYQALLLLPNFLITKTKQEEILFKKYVSNFALLSNLMLLMGKRFKTNEFASGKMADILGSLYIITSLSWFVTHNNEIKKIAEVAKLEEFIKIQKNIDSVITNYDFKIIKLFMKTFNLKIHINNNITDKMKTEISNEITKNAKVREILSENVFIPNRLKIMNQNLDKILEYHKAKNNQNSDLEKLIEEFVMVDSFSPDLPHLPSN
jgi:acyl-CoA dehydrogenase